MNMIKKVSVILALMSVPALAYAGGPISRLPIKAQLRQEAQAIQVLTQAVEHGAAVAKMTPKVQRLDYAVQNTAMQMRVKADFARNADALIDHTNRIALLENLKVDGQWVQAHQ